MNEQQIIQALLDKGVKLEYIEKYKSDLVGMIENSMEHMHHTFDEAILFVKKIIDRVEEN